MSPASVPSDSGPTPVLRATVQVSRGSFESEISLEVARGEVLALLGPNGAGKSTVLAALAGLLEPESGSIEVAGRPVYRSRAPRIWVQPYRRRIGLLGQEALLFPFSTALANVAYGPRAQGRSRATATSLARGWLDAVGLLSLADRKPAQLSGGQAQRVAIARALAAEPEVLLLDEPLASLDVQTASEIRRVLAEQLRSSGTATILVTHDALDALALSDRCVVLHQGRVIDQGPTARVLGIPRSPFVAALVGMNMLTGTLKEKNDDGGAQIAVEGKYVFAGRSENVTQLRLGQKVHAIFAPTDVLVRPLEAPERHGDQGLVAAETGGMEEEEPGEGWYRVAIESLEPIGAGIRIHTREIPGLFFDLGAAQTARWGVQPGTQLDISVPEREVKIQPDPQT